MAQNNAEHICKEQHDTRVSQKVLLDLYIFLVKQCREHPRLFKIGLIATTFFGLLSSLSLPDAVSAQELAQYIDPSHNNFLQASALPFDMVHTFDRKNVLIQTSASITDTLWTIGSYTTTNTEMQLFISQYPGLNAKRIWEVQKGKDEGRGLPQPSQLKPNTWTCGYAVAEPESAEYRHFLHVAKTKIEVGIQQGTRKEDDLHNGTILVEAYAEWKKQVSIDLTLIYGEETSEKLTGASCTSPIILSSPELTTTHVTSTTEQMESKPVTYALLDTEYGLSVSVEGNVVLAYEFEGQKVYEAIPIPHSVYNTHLVRTASTLVLTYFTNDDDNVEHLYEITYFGRNAQGVPTWSVVKELEISAEPTENSAAPLVIGGVIVGVLLLGLDSVNRASKQNYISSPGQTGKQTVHKEALPTSSTTSATRPGRRKKSAKVDSREAGIRKDVEKAYTKQVQNPGDISSAEKKKREKAALRANKRNIDAAVQSLLKK